MSGALRRILLWLCAAGLLAAALGLAFLRGGRPVFYSDGSGLHASDSAGSHGHYGLQIMSERARRLGGRLDVGARTGGGTRVRLAFPRPPLPAEAH